MKSSKSQIKIIVRDFNQKILSKALVTLSPLGKKGSEEIVLEFKELDGFYESNSIPNGNYSIAVFNKGLRTDNRTVKLLGGLKNEIFILGKKGMPYYHRGVVKVPFEPIQKIGLTILGDIESEQYRAFENTCKRFALIESMLSLKCLEDGNTLVLDIPININEEELEKALIQIEEHTIIGNVGRVLEMNEDALTFMSRQIIIRFSTKVNQKQVATIAKEYSLEVVRMLPYVPNGWVVNTRLPASMRLLDLINRLNGLETVKYAEPSLILTLSDLAINPTDYLYPEQWHIPLVNLPDAWETLRNANAAGVSPGDPNDRTFGSPDVVIGIFDRGILSNTVAGTTTAIHPDFAGNLTNGNPKVSQFFDFANMVANNDSPPNSHGMGCGGVATALANNPSAITGVNEGIVGAAPNCSLLGAIRPSSGSEQNYSDAFVWMSGMNPGWTVDGVNYPMGTVFPATIANPTSIISCSFSWPSSSISGLMSDTFDYITSQGRGGRGVAVFWAAGNYSNNTFPISYGTALYPKVMAVGASTLANDGTTEIKSNYSGIGNAIEFVTPSHDEYTPIGIEHNPNTNFGVISAELLRLGNMPGNPANQTTLSAVANSGNINISVGSSVGFTVGDAVLIGVSGANNTEAHRITAIPNVTTLTVTPLNNNHPSGTTVAGAAANYKNNFGGTSSAAPLAAGIAALCLSINPALSWVELRQILRTTANRIDLTNTTPTGQWIDTNGDGTANFSQWYGWGRLDANAAVISARDYDSDSDIVVRDNLDDEGAIPSAGWHAHSPDIWVRRTNDVIPTLAYDASPPHHNPQSGQDNYIFVRVKNKGTAASSDCWVRVLIAHYPGFEFRYPQEWTPSNFLGNPLPSPLVPGSYLIDEVNIPSLNADEDTIIKMTWDAALVPPENVMVGGMNVRWHPCLLTEVSPHDGPMPSGTTFDVKDYNNLAHRNISINYDSDSDLSVGMVAGTANSLGLQGIVLDRSNLPASYRVYMRIADNNLMNQWVKAVAEDRIAVVPSLDDHNKNQTYGPEETLLNKPIDSDCGVVLLDKAKLLIHCCDGKAIVIEAPAKSKISTIQRCGTKDRLRLSLGEVQGQQVIFFDSGENAIEMPTHIEGGKYVPVIIGISKPNSKETRGLLMINQRLRNGALSTGYSLQS